MRRLGWLGLLCLWAPAPAQAQSGCVAHPDLCNLAVTTTTEQPDLAVAIDVVLVGDGFTSMAAWHTLADSAITSFRGATSNMYGRVPALYNFHVVDVVSAGTDVTNADTGDTALGMRVSGPFIDADGSRVSLAALNAPDVDVVVAIANSGTGRANANYSSQLASGGVVRLSSNVSVITHELGHALFHLADEYEEASLCGSPSESSMLLEPNVTTDSTCFKFHGAGCVQGGRYCSSGVYRSAASCLMRSNNGAACPACAEEIDTVLRERRSAADWAPPWLVATPPGRGTPVAGSVLLEAQAHDDWFTPTTLSFEIDGAFVGSTSAGSFAQLRYDSTRLADGAHTLEVYGADLAGYSAAARPVSFNTANAGDTTVPVLSIGSPAAGALVSGSAPVFVNCTGQTADLRELVLLIDGQPVAAAASSSSLFYSWDVSQAALGPHTLDARATDFSENVGNAPSVTVTATTGTGGRPPILPQIQHPLEAAWSDPGSGSTGRRRAEWGAPRAAARCRWS